MLGEHNNSLLGSKVVLSGDSNRASITSKMDAVSGDLHPAIAQTHEYSDQSWGSNFAKDDFRCDDESDIGCRSGIVLSDDVNFFVFSSDDND